MNTLRLFATGLENVPLTTAWCLADHGEDRGKQEFFTRQSPQRLKVLREHALIESAVSSNRIEGVTVERSRIGMTFHAIHWQDTLAESVRKTGRCIVAHEAFGQGRILARMAGPVASPGRFTIRAHPSWTAPALPGA